MTDESLRHDLVAHRMDYLVLDRMVVHSVCQCPCCFNDLPVGFPQDTRFPWANCPVCGIPLVWQTKEVTPRMFEFTVGIDIERTIVGET